MDAASIERRLVERAVQLTQRDAALQKHLRGQDGRLEADFSDRVAFTEMDEVIEALDDEARAELTSIQAALRRLRDGSYGTCTSCGADIQAGRLEALPSAALCVSCATARDA